jgi:hypothetical protein
VNPFVRFAVPPGVVRDTVLAPAVPAEVTAVTVVALTTLTLVAAAPPIITKLVPVRFEPVIVIAVPPEIGPAFGLTDEIVGCAKYVNPFARLATPPGVDSDTAFAPTVDAGVTAVTVVALTTVTVEAAVPPMVKLVRPVRLVPVIVIAVPPAIGPAFGLTDEIVGTA